MAIQNNSQNIQESIHFYHNLLGHWGDADLNFNHRDQRSCKWVEWSLGWLACEWTLLLPGHLAIQVMLSVSSQFPRNGTRDRASMLFLKGKGGHTGRVMSGWAEGRAGARWDITKLARALQENIADYLVTRDVSKETIWNHCILEHSIRE